MNQPTARFVRGSRVLSRSFGSESLLALPEREEVEVLSGTASVVWDLLEAPSTTANVVAILERLFDAADGVVAADVDALLQTLLERGLIEEVASG